ncbi:hypothetical protein LTR17_026932 [Elasticomyces elasticus]|nr:hypothetical protein LTR17_026932 [Elasticomyces elasticus]
MSRDEAARFWSDWARMLRVGGEEASIILGINGSKDGDKVFRAYNDRDGANKRFIENAIPQANKQLGYEAFKPDDWRQQGEWNAAEGKHDQYLVPVEDVGFEDVQIAEGERVYIVTSVKYDDKEKARLFRASGLTEVERYTNDDGSYARIPPMQQHTTLRHGGYGSSEDTVKRFNDLPQPRTIFGGMPNHWIFAIRRMPYEPYLTMLVTAHPQSGDVFQMATSRPTDEVMQGVAAGSPDAVVTLLLFAPLQHERIEAIDTPIPEEAEANRARAPFSWATESQALADATAASLRAQGVRESLCSVEVASKKQMEILDEVWLSLTNDTKQQMQAQYSSSPTPTEATRYGIILSDVLTMR